MVTWGKKIHSKNILFFIEPKKYVIIESNILEWKNFLQIFRKRERGKCVFHSTSKNIFIRFVIELKNKIYGPGWFHRKELSKIITLCHFYPLYTNNQASPTIFDKGKTLP